MKLFKLTLLIVWITTANAYAEYGTSKWGVELQGFSNSTGYSFVKGGVVGVHADQYFSGTNAFVGFDLKTGTYNGLHLATDNLTYGGLELGFDKTYDIFHVESSVLIGYGYGSLGSSVTVQPQIGAGLVVIDGWRAVFTMGYLVAPSMPISGFVFGIKLDKKTVDQGYGTRN